ncbi:TOMM precursor leader peptide-binding protein [Nonomuraea angiospora]|uniref:TOMM precursor leader peptide-binding protein n=1 Tax=Nonomuraea angiospora TaxID=46172 RepID=UPI00331CAAE6
MAVIERENDGPPVAVRTCAVAAAELESLRWDESYALVTRLLAQTARVEADGRRLAAMEAFPRTAGHVSVSPVAAAVVAGQVVADLGRCLSGTPRVSGGPRLHVVDLDGFGTRTHSFLPHLAVLPPGTGASAGPLGEEEFSRRAARLMDSRTGVLAEIEEGEYGQLPLHVSVTTAADPMGILGGSRARVIGVGADFAVARYRAALKAITVHGLLALDPRRLVTAEGTPLTGDGERPPSDGLPVDPLVDDVAAGRVEAFVRGRDLVEGGEVLLPARAVFLDSHATGAAAGYSAEDALVAGLLGHCAALAGFGGPLPAVDVGGARAADDETARSAALLDAIGLPYQVLLQRPGEPGCLTCFETRRDRVRTDSADRAAVLAVHGPELAERASPYLGRLAARTIAALAVHAAEGPGCAVWYVDLRTLTAERHTSLPEPHCPDCGGLPDDDRASAVFEPGAAPRPPGYRVRDVPAEHGALLDTYVDGECGLIRPLVRDTLGGLVIAGAMLPLRFEGGSRAVRSPAWAAPAATGPARSPPCSKRSNGAADRARHGTGPHHPAPGRRDHRGERLPGRAV